MALLQARGGDLHELGIRMVADFFEMNGWDTIHRIVENDLYDGNIIVMLTALNAPDNKMEGIQEYVTDYLTKPFNPDELMETLEYYFGLLNALGTGNGQ